MSYQAEILHNISVFQASSNPTLHQISDFITSPFISLILTCIIFLGFLYQLYSKRINFPGILAALALLILFLGYLIQGEVSLISVGLFSIGVILLVIELFVIGAVIGIIGMILITVSMIMLGENILWMLVNVIIALILTIIEWVILVKGYNKKISLFEKVILRDSTTSEAGYTSHDDRSNLVGQTAITLTELRPAGMISLNDERIDAVSDGTFIQRDVEVKVTEVEGSRVVVREIPKNT
ncbi:NfeD family protein [Staphylococcus simulans]|uniref:NfeD family protein n=1 Tax=Staphylococcus simulans TaxID=1286 RepID=UPI000D0362AE|nr:NfeD family protein [Staphylococcus simulans]PTJ18798.1 serine protease [Staphylococcus simulans]PTJ49291.1 serine protease [Staphylococcus simulans]PTJ84750.1 serine protease [Staphylococcus simulans]